MYFIVLTKACNTINHDAHIATEDYKALSPCHLFNIISEGTVHLLLVDVYPIVKWYQVRTTEGVSKYVVQVCQWSQAGLYTLLTLLQMLNGQSLQRGILDGARRMEN